MSDFVRHIHELIAHQKLFHPVGEFVNKLGLALCRSSDHDRLLDIVKQVATIAKTRPNKQKYLNRMASELYNMELADGAWMEEHIAKLPEQKSRKRTEYSAPNQCSDFRRKANPSMNVQVFDEGNPEFLAAVPSSSSSYIRSVDQELIAAGSSGCVSDQGDEELIASVSYGHIFRMNSSEVSSVVSESPSRTYLMIRTRTCKLGLLIRLSWILQSEIFM